MGEDFIIILNDAPVATELDPVDVFVTVEENNTNINSEQTLETKTEVTEQTFTIEIGSSTQYVQGDTANGTVKSASFGDSTPALLYTVTSDFVLDSIQVLVDEAFNGFGSYFEIGTISSPSLFYAREETDISLSVEYDKSFSAYGPIDLYLTIYPGALCSQGKLIIQITTLPRG